MIMKAKQKGNYIMAGGTVLSVCPDKRVYTMAFVTPVVEHWLERDIREIDSTDPSHFERKEGKVLFKDAVKTLYLRLPVYGVGHMVKDHPYS